jgi:hypothetical protein
VKLIRLFCFQYYYVLDYKPECGFTFETEKEGDSIPITNHIITRIPQIAGYAAAADILYKISENDGKVLAVGFNDEDAIVFDPWDALPHYTHFFMNNWNNWDYEGAKCEWDWLAQKVFEDEISGTIYVPVKWF